MCNWFEDMCFVWVFIVMDNYCSIFIKFDVRIVSMMSVRFCMNDNGFNYFIFFNNFIWCCLFDSSNNNVIDVSSFMIRFV